MQINKNKIGNGNPVYIIAEMSANHGGDYERAVDIIHAAKECGADAIKLQTYTADTLTLDCNVAPFFLEKGPWAGQTMHELYKKAYTPWEWQPKLKEIADKIGITLFSSPFDISSVDFLEKMDIPAYKIASPEIIEYQLIAHIARTGKPIIMSTGKATLSEIDNAVRIAKTNGCSQIALLHCVSEYPAPFEQMNLRTIEALEKIFNIPVGLSDHSHGIGVAIASVAIGATIIEKHFIIDKSMKTADSFFSMDKDEFSQMTKEIRNIEKAMGTVYFPTEINKSRRSVYAIMDIKAGEIFSDDNIGSFRPGGGLMPEMMELIKGKKAQGDIKRGSYIFWEMV